MQAAKTNQGLQKRLRKVGVAEGWPCVVEGKNEGWEGPEIKSEKETCSA